MSEIINEEGVSQSKLDGILRKVQSLLNLAEHPNTGEVEADAFRERAERLMREYRIEESMLIQSDPTSAVRPIRKTWGICETGSPYLQAFYSLFVYCAQHAGVRMTYTFGPDPDNDGKRSLLAEMVGYESDVRYTIMLYAIVRLAFSGKMEPKMDANLSDEDNVYNLRSAGLERIRIADLMGWGTSVSACQRVTSAYRRACNARGEVASLTGKGNSVKLYRQSFADAFTNGVYYRLRELRVRSGVGGGGELVLANRKEKVDEAFYEAFPNMRPKPVKYDGEARIKGRPRKYIEPKYSEIGLRAGRKAADEIDFTRRTTPAARKLEGEA